MTTTIPAPATASPPRCGDGLLQVGEECDDVDGGSDEGCLDDGTRKPAPCGDDFVWKDVELLDDGIEIDGDGCGVDCAPSP